MDPNQASTLIAYVDTIGERLERLEATIAEGNRALCILGSIMQDQTGEWDEVLRRAEYIRQVTLDRGPLNASVK